MADEDVMAEVEQQARAALEMANRLAAAEARCAELEASDAESLRLYRSAQSRAARYEEALRDANRFLRQFHGSINLASVVQLTEKIDAALAGGE